MGGATINETTLFQAPTSIHLNIVTTLLVGIRVSYNIEDVAQVVTKLGHVNIIPTMQFSLEFPEIFTQNDICRHRLSVSGISKIMHCAILRSMPYYETESLPPPCHKRLNSSYFYSVNSFCFSLETTCHGTHATLSLSVKLNTISYSESTAMLAQKYHTHGSFSYH